MKTIGNFSVEGELARGGMGVVLRARQNSLGRPAVLKRIRRELADDPVLSARFEREARAAAAIHHQNVVAVYDCFRWRGDHFLAQEFVDGADLRSVLHQAGPLPWRIAAGIALEISRGLEEIHARATVHRDLKPANILISRRGEAKIADFGIALEASSDGLTHTGMLVGSPAYTAPEQWQGERADSRGDVFGFGVMLYQMLRGHVPFALRPASGDGEAADTPEPDDGSLVEQMRRERYPALPRQVPRALARLVRSCLRARPRRRPASAGELRRALERLLGRPSPADLQRELAGFLWERGVFRLRESETLVQLASATGDRPLPRWASALLVLMALAGSVLVVDVRPAPRLEMTAPREPEPVREGVPPLRLSRPEPPLPVSPHPRLPGSPHPRGSADPGEAPSAGALEERATQAPSRLE